MTRWEYRFVDLFHRPEYLEKDLLARPGMAIDTGHLGRRFDDHIYTSRENASGGTGVGGGGCGCN